MSYVQKYLQDARSFANEKHLNMVGWEDFAGNQGAWYGADGEAAAPAAPTMAQMRTSQPYIITISNASATSTSNFDILGAYQYLGTGTFSSGSLVSGNTVSYTHLTLPTILLV